MSTPKPPRLMEALLERRLASDPHGDSTIGDLAEGFAHRRASGSRLAARWWYARQAVSLLLTGGAPATTYRDTGREAGWWARSVDVIASALRQLRRRPGFTLGVGAVLTVAVAATSAAFSVTVGTYDAAHWWEDEDRALLIWPEEPFSRGQLDVLRTENRAFEAIGGILRQPALVSIADREVSTAAVALSVELYEALLAGPVVGRGLQPEDGGPGAEPVVVLGHGLWRRAFGGQREVIGRVVEVNGVARRVVGVMAPGASQPGPGTELWVPLILDPRDPDFWPSRELTVAGIAREGTSVADARADVRRVLGDLALRFSFFFKPDWGSDATVFSSADRTWGAVALPLVLLLAGTVLLLLVAAIDVGNLVLARSLERGPEMRIRVAIGASRGQVVRQIIFESAIPAALAVIAGAWLGAVLAGLLPGLFPFDTAVAALAPTDPRVLAFVACVAVAAWLLTAGIPTAHFLASTRRAVAPRFARGAAARRFVVAQAALSTMLMVTAGLLFRTVVELERLPLGFDAEETFVMPVAPSPAPLSAGQLMLLRAGVAERVAAAAPVHAAGWISPVPLIDPVLRAPVNREEEPVQVAEAPTAARFVVDHGALAALGIEVTRGRGFASTDDAAAAPVALISEAMARAFWPDADPVGRRIAVDPHGWTDWITVVGVVQDIRYEGLVLPPRPAFFLPRDQAPGTAMSLVVRASSGPVPIVSLVRSALAAHAPEVAVGEPRALRSIVHGAQGPARVMTSLLGILALLAAALGALGLYASLAGWVARRRAEIGTRLALGATPINLAGHVLAQGVALTGAGVVVGAIGAAASARAIRGLLFGVSPLDPIAFALPTVLLLAIGTVAAALPAFRAATVPPAEAFRST